MLTDFELVLINGEVVRQDFGYNSMGGLLEAENWFMFDDEQTLGAYQSCVHQYNQAILDFQKIKKQGRGVHLVNIQSNKDSSVMYIPVQSILCIRKINPYNLAERPRPEQEQLENTEEQEEQAERKHGELENEAAQRISSAFDRVRRPVIRKKKEKEGGV